MTRKVSDGAQANLRVALQGKVALVTGASSGIGRAVAIALAESGACVVLNYRKNTAGAEEAVESTRAAGNPGWAHQADVSDPAAVTAMVEQICQRAGGIDILVNNAGDPVAASPIEECTPEVWDQAMANNLRSVFLCSRAVIGPMKARGGGRIINISSIGAVAGGSPWTLPYAAAKGGVETFTRGLARVLGPDGTTVNAVAPGSIRTEMQTAFVPPDYITRTTAQTALGRTGQPGEVAAAVLFLASDAAKFITGQIIRVDGGRSH